MADLAVMTHRHVGVAAAERSGSSSGGPRSPASSPFEQLLRTRLASARLPVPGADGLQAGQDVVDHDDRKAGRSDDPLSRPSRRRAQARQSIDHLREGVAAAPEQRQTDRRSEAAGETGAGSRAEVQTDAPVREPPKQRPREEHAAEPETPPAVNATDGNAQAVAAAAAPPAGTAMPEHGGTQGPAPTVQAGAPTPSAPPPSLGPIRDAAVGVEPPPVMTAPAHAQATSLTREADILHSQPSAALAPGAVLAADSAEEAPPRLRAAVTTATGARTGLAAIAGGADEAVAGTGSNGAPTAASAARAAGGAHGAPAATGTAFSGGDMPSAAGLQGAALQASAGQLEAGQNKAGGPAATAITGALGAQTGKVPAAAATTTDPRSLTGTGEGTAIGGMQTPLHAGRSPQASAVPLAPTAPQRLISDQVSVEIRKGIHEGADRIEIRLKPETLGRVDVRLEVGADNRVIATITAEQRHTLELLRADARSLERALQEAGLQTDGGSLNFNLRGGEDGRPGSHNARSAATLAPGSEGSIGNTAEDPPADIYRRPAERPDGIDIRA